MWHWSADTLFWQLSFDHKLDVRYEGADVGYGRAIFVQIFLDA